MKKCPSCGQLLADSVLNCPSCGKEVFQDKDRKYIDDYEKLEFISEGERSVLYKAVKKGGEDYRPIEEFRGYKAPVIVQGKGVEGYHQNEHQEKGKTVKKPFAHYGGKGACLAYVFPFSYDIGADKLTSPGRQKAIAHETDTYGGKKAMEFHPFYGLQEIFPSFGPDEEGDNIHDNGEENEKIVGLPGCRPDLF